MLGFQNYNGAEGVEFILDGCSDLHGQAFLNLRAAGVAIDEAGEFGQTSDFTSRLWQVTNVCLSEKGDEMVLADRIEGNISDNDDFIVIDVEGLIDVGAWILGDAAADLSIHASHSGGSFSESVAIGIFTDCDEDFFNGFFYTWVVHDDLKCRLQIWLQIQPVVLKLRG